MAAASNAHPFRKIVTFDEVTKSHKPRFDAMSLFPEGAKISNFIKVIVYHIEKSMEVIIPELDLDFQHIINRQEDHDLYIFLYNPIDMGKFCFEARKAIPHSHVWGPLFRSNSETTSEDAFFTNVKEYKQEHVFVASPCSFIFDTTNKCACCTLPLPDNADECFYAFS